METDTSSSIQDANLIVTAKDSSQSQPSSTLQLPSFESLAIPPPAPVAAPEDDFEPFVSSPSTNPPVSSAVPADAPVAAPEDDFEPFISSTPINPPSSSAVPTDAPVPAPSQPSLADFAVSGDSSVPVVTVHGLFPASQADNHSREPSVGAAGLNAPSVQSQASSASFAEFETAPPSSEIGAIVTDVKSESAVAAPVPLVPVDGSRGPVVAAETAPVHVPVAQPSASTHVVAAPSAAPVPATQQQVSATLAAAPTPQPITTHQPAQPTAVLPVAIAKMTDDQTVPQSSPLSVGAPGVSPVPSPARSAIDGDEGRNHGHTVALAPPSDTRSVVSSRSGEPLADDLPMSPSAVSDGGFSINSEVIMSPLATVQEAQVGSETTCVHILFHSKMGWMAWKDREASLFSVFERGFAATKASIKFNDTLDHFGVEVEVPNEQVTNLEKQLRGRTLLAEIDRCHGILPPMRVTDARVTKITKSMGSTIKTQNTKSSVESLEARVRALESCGRNRMREVTAMCEQWTALKEQLETRMRQIETKMLARPERLVKMEEEVVEIVQEELRNLQAW
ncbi:hypothetical protein HDU96_000945 [Phlyctochytrium bullatum]|nr:hypothetical protein HDU96_000945 [Phlyctochytrium bullatum]